MIKCFLWRTLRRKKLTSISRISVIYITWKTWSKFQHVLKTRAIPRLLIWCWQTQSAIFKTHIHRHANSPDFGGRLPIFFVDFTSSPIIDYNQQTPDFYMICHESFIFIIFLCPFVDFSESWQSKLFSYNI